MRNKQNESSQEHLIIKNPFTGRFINLLPLLKTLNGKDITGFNTGENSAYKTIDDSIRLLNTALTEDALHDKIRYLADCLYMLRDGFGDVSEFKNSNCEL